MIRKHLVGVLVTAAIALGLSSSGLAQQSVIIRKPDNSAAVDPATAGNQATANGSLSSIDGKLTNEATAANQTTVQATAGADASKAVAVQGVTGGKAVKVDGSAVTQPISATALPLPAGAATSANQATELTSLSSIVTNTGAGSTAANQTAQQAVPGSDATKAVAVQGVTGGKAVKVDGSAVTQPISAAALPLPSGAATAANQATELTSLSSIVTNTTGAATAANQTSANTKLDQLHTDMIAPTPAGTNLIGKVGLDQTTPGTTNGVVVNASALPTGAATAANQTTGNSSLSSLDTKTPSLGQTTKSASRPVTIASDQYQATSTDASGTVTTGGTFQTVFASNSARRGCLVQNPTSAIEPMTLKVGTMAQAFSLPIGATFSCAASGGLVVTDAITITAPTTGHAFAAVSQ